MPPKKLKQRLYLVSWNWADNVGGPFLVDEIQATTAPRAQSKLFKQLREEYAEVNTRNVIVHEIALKG